MELRGARLAAYAWDIAVRQNRQIEHCRQESDLKLIFPDYMHTDVAWSQPQKVQPDPCLTFKIVSVAELWPEDLQRLSCKGCDHVPLVILLHQCQDYGLGLWEHTVPPFGAVLLLSKVQLYFTYLQSVFIEFTGLSSFFPPMNISPSLF